MTTTTMNVCGANNEDDDLMFLKNTHNNRMTTMDFEEMVDF